MSAVQDVCTPVPSSSLGRSGGTDTFGSTSSSGLYVGHSTSGDVVLAASHYDAMAGLATTAGELGLKDTGKDGGRALIALLTAVPKNGGAAKQE